MDRDILVMEQAHFHVRQASIKIGIVMLTMNAHLVHLVGVIDELVNSELFNLDIF